MYKVSAPSLEQKLLFFLALTLAAALLLFPEAVAAGIKNGTELSLHTLLPSLFPFLFACDLAMQALYCAFPALPSAAAKLAAWTAGQLGGFVAGAKCIVSLRQRGTLSEREAALFLCGCVNAGPAFLISAVGAGMFGSKTAGFCLYGALQLASAVCSLAVLPLCEKSAAETNTSSQKNRPASFAASVSASLRATAGICAAATLFCCFTSLLNTALPALPAALQTALSLLLEVSSGCTAAARLGGRAGLFLAAAAVSLCGLSVLGQLQFFLTEAKISLRPFLLSRLLHLPLTQLFLHLLLQLLPDDAAAWAAASGDAAAAFSISPYAAAALFGSCCCALAGRRMISPLYERDKKGV